MKKILQIFILLNSIFSFSQEKLSGLYCSLPIGGADVTCIDFKSNNRFEFSNSGCLGAENIGSGNFELRNKTLVLKFDKTQQTKKSIVNVEEMKSNNDKVEFEFIVKDENGAPHYVMIYEKPYKSKYDIVEDGNKIVVDKRDAKVKYEITSIGYETLELDLNQNSSKRIHITMFPAQPKVISDKVYEWDLTEINEDEFKTGPESWNTFTKVKR